MGAGAKHPQRRVEYNKDTRLLLLHAMHSTPIRRFSDKLLSTVHRGTAFEYRALALLTKYMSMSLTRVGGSHDGGVDLIGWWWVPDDGENQNPTTVTCGACPCTPSLTTRVLPNSSIPSSDPLKATEPEPRAWNDATNRRRLRVLAQCKAEKRKVGPAYLRELEGVVYRHTASSLAGLPDAFLRLPPQHQGHDDLASSDPNTNTPYAHAHVHSHPTPTSAESISATEEPPPVALLISQSAFTRSCLLTAYASPLPFLLVHLPSSTSTVTTNNNSASSTSGTLGAVFGNPALVSTRGVLGGQLEIRWERGGGATPVSGVQASGSGDGGDGPGLWWQGQPLPSWTPDAKTVVDTAVFSGVEPQGSAPPHQGATAPRTL